MTDKVSTTIWLGPNERAQLDSLRRKLRKRQAKSDKREPTKTDAVLFALAYTDERVKE